MFSADDEATTVRLAAAHHRAAAEFAVTITGEPLWGWRGRTIGAKTTAPDGAAAWLRVLSAPEEKAGGKLWEGTARAAKAMPRVAKPALLAERDWTADGFAYRAELTAFAADPVLSLDPVMREEVQLTDAWFTELRRSLDLIAAVPTDRSVIGQDYLNRAMPAFLGLEAGPATTAEVWSTAHGDLHLANLTGPSLTILDWEGWGAAPQHYDIAVLHSYCLLAPATAARIHQEFEQEFASPAGRFAELAVIAELLQTVSRGDNLDLEAALRERTAALLTTAAP